MAAAAVFIFAPALLLALAGSLLLRDAVRGARLSRPSGSDSSATPAASAANSSPTTRSRWGTILRFAASAGTLLCAVLAGAGPWLPMQYGVIVIPFTAIVLAVAWDVVLLTGAAVADRLAARS